MIGFPDLDEATERLYSAFARYPLPAELDYCEHCVIPAEVAATRARPLRLLSADDLHPLMWRALFSWGDEAELIGAFSDAAWYATLEHWVEGSAVTRLLDAAASTASTPDAAAELNRARELLDRVPTAAES